MTADGPLTITKAAYREDDGAVDPSCACPTCTTFSRAYLRHLFVVDEPTGPRLVTLHNLSWTLQLLRRVRGSLVDGTFEGVRAEVHAAWA